MSVSLAKKFLTESYGSYPHMLKLWREEFWLWDGQVFGKLSKRNLKNFLRVWMNDNGHVVSRNKVLEVLEDIEGKVQVPDNLDMPVWIGDDSYNTGRKLMAMKNGLVDLDELLRKPLDEVTVEPLSPRWFSVVGFPYEFDPEAECPKWMEQLLLVTGSGPCLSDEDSRNVMDLLEEFFGLCLTEDTSFKTMLMLYGESGTGKSTITNVLEELVGEKNRDSVPLENFGKEFSLGRMQGKLVNICGDVDKIARLAEGILKRATGEDTMQYNEKYKPIVSGKMTAKIVVAANDFPRVSESTDALWNRLLIVPMDHVFEEQDRRFFETRSPDWVFREELPGIFNWAVEGLKRLYERGRFEVPGVCEELKERLRGENSSASLFIRSRCSYDPEGRIPKEEVREEYATWCDRRKFQAVDIRTFGRVLGRMIPEIRKDGRMRVDGVLKKYYYGLKME